MRMPSFTFVSRKCVRSESTNIGTNDSNRVLLSDDNLDGFAPYRVMLERFLEDSDGFQAIQEAFTTLRFALAASLSEWNHS